MATIYISSTYRDLADYREAVYRALRKLGHNVISMEDYTASNQKPLDKCLADVDKCEIYVGIFAWRYGYIPPGQTSSITEIEFREASKREKVCLMFLLDEDTSWEASQKDLALEKITSLREELKRDYLVSFFRNKDDLAVQVSTAVSNALVSSIAEKRDPQSRPATEFTVEVMVYSPEAGVRFNILIQRKVLPTRWLLIFNLYKKYEGEFVQIVGVAFEAAKKHEQEAIASIANGGINVSQYQAFNEKVYPSVKALGSGTEPTSEQKELVHAEIRKAILLKV